MDNSISLRLGENGSQPHHTGIGLQYERLPLTKHWVRQDRGGSQHLLELVKGNLTLASSPERGILPGQGM